MKVMRITGQMTGLRLSVQDNDEPYSVTARKTGIIERMQVYLGAPLVEVGDAVLEGEPLVSGRVESGLGSVRYVHASALVEARTGGGKSR